MTDILIILGKNIKFYRGNLNMTQEELALKTGINRSYLASLESGKRNTTVKTVEILANALSVSVTDLVQDR